MNPLVKHVLAALVAVAVPAGPALAATHWDDNGLAIDAAGDGKFFIGDCSGKAVRLTGDRQNITLFGKCKSVVSRGSYTHITLDGATSIKVVGHDNVVKWKTKPDSVNAVGPNNALTKA